ncbi:hypothetical protein CZ787_16750 [Halomonas citrativorans]|uniref:Uncharacterized protein n=1 Tax=Halomonas citrativorans TaxID=2742612 RepID=A0A1R4I4V1_9GAMM|nr:hypothetical protein CZ787_16750 [Halomonas citrativorans]
MANDCQRLSIFSRMLFYESPQTPAAMGSPAIVFCEVSLLERRFERTGGLFQDR